MNPHDHRCCQHNVAQGWPYYAEHLWLATGGDGLAARCLRPGSRKGRRRAKSHHRRADALSLQRADRTDAHHRGTGDVSALSFMSRGGAHGSRLSINGKSIPIEAATDKYLKIARTWTNTRPSFADVANDRAGADLEANGNSGVHKTGTADVFAEDRREVRPPGRDGRLARLGNPSPRAHRSTGWCSIRATPPHRSRSNTSRGPLRNQPFTTDAVPIELRVQARRLFPTSELASRRAGRSHANEPDSQQRAIGNRYVDSDGSRPAENQCLSHD